MPSALGLVATEFASFVAGKIIQVKEAIPGSVVPLTMFKKKLLSTFSCKLSSSRPTCFCRKFHFPLSCDKQNGSWQIGLRQLGPTVRGLIYLEQHKYKMQLSSAGFVKDSEANFGQWVFWLFFVLKNWTKNQIWAM